MINDNSPLDTKYKHQWPPYFSNENLENILYQFCIYKKDYIYDHEGLVVELI